MPSYQQVRIYDVINKCPGALVPADIKKLYDKTYSATSVTTIPYDGIQYYVNYYNTPYRNILINKLYAQKFLPMLRYSTGVTQQCVPVSATTNNVAYNIFPYAKYVNFTVWESIAGPANFEYFRIQAGTTGGSYYTTASLTWPSVSSSSSKGIELPLGNTYTTSGYLFTVYFGGMNTSRLMYYSDDVCSPGVWKRVGDYQNARFGPADYFGSENTCVTTDKLYDYTPRVLTYKEYCYRVNHICVYVRNNKDGAPTNTPGTTDGYYYYSGSTCSSYCSSDCSSDCSSYTY